MKSKDQPHRMMQNKPKNGNLLFLAAIAVIAAATTAQAQDTLVDDNFDSGTTGSWTLSGTASLYEFTSGTNYATSGNYAIKVPTLGGGAFATLTTGLALASPAYTEVTIAFDYKWNATAGTRFLFVDYSTDGGATWSTNSNGSGWIKITASSLTGSFSQTLLASTEPFTDNVIFRFRGKTDSGPTIDAYVDNVVITAAPGFSGLYWDGNGATAGAGAAPTGTWGTDLFWSTSLAGDVATAAWTPGVRAIFSAGSDATGAYAVTVDGTQDIGGLAFQDGTVTLSGGTALQMTSDTGTYVDDAVTATIATPLADDGLSGGGGWAFSKDGSGTLILSGDNSDATGAMALNGGITRFDSPTSINGTGENVTVNGGAILLFGSPFVDTNIQAALDRIVTTSAGTIAVDNYDSTDFDFGAATLTAAYLGAIADTSYTGLLTPDGSTYRLGGAGGKLTLTDTSGMSDASPTFQILGDVEISGNITAVTGTLTKQNSGTLILSGANSYSANTTASGGTLVLAGSNSAASQTTVNAATLQLASASNGGLASGQMTLNNNSAVLQAVDADRSITNNVLLNSSPKISGSQSLAINGALTVNNNRTLYNNINAPGKELILAGQVNLSNNDTGRTLTLRSDINSANIKFNVTGDIVDGGLGAGGVTLTANFRDNEPFYFSGTNTYSGKTEITNGTLFIQGAQALSPNTSVRLNHTSGNNGKIWLLDDTSGNINLPNAFDFDTNNSGGNHTIFVGNNNTANGGTSAGTTTGGTFVISTLTSFDVNGDTSYQSVNILGANDYSLRVDSFELNNLTSRSAGKVTETRLNPTTANLSIGAITMAAGNAGVGADGVPLLVLQGSATGNKVTGAISDATDALTTGQPLPLTKSGSSIWSLNGANTYTGATTITGGTLLVNGSLDAASAVAVNGTSTLGGSGTIGGSVIVAAGASVAPGTPGFPLTVNGDLDLSALAGGAGLLDFELNTIAASDKIVAGTLNIGTDLLGLSDFSLADLGGLQNGTYTLISSDGLTGSIDPADVDGTLGAATIQLQTSGGNIVLAVSGLAGGTAYDSWAGGELFDADANGDGVKNGLAFLLGAADPNADATGLLPVVSETGGSLVLTFSCLNDANNGTATLNVEHSSDLGITDAWAGAAVPEASGGPDNGVTFAVTGGDPLNSVTATIDAGQAAGGKLFGRLRAVNP